MSRILIKSIRIKFGVYKHKYFAVIQKNLKNMLAIFCDLEIIVIIRFILP